MTPAFSEALALLSPRQKGRGFVAKCPAHEDANPSLNIDDAGDKIVLFCHGGCSTTEVVSAMGLSMTDLFEPDTTASPERVETDYYDYRSEDGKLLFQVVRFRPKGFTQRRPLPGGLWAYDLDGVDRVIYRLPEVIAADEVIIVEGEKDADRLAAAGFTATTSPSGATKWRHEFGDYFVGKNVVLIPDLDKAGRQHAEVVRASVQPKARRFRVLELPGLVYRESKGPDVSDWLDAGHTADELRALLRPVVAPTVQQFLEAASNDRPDLYPDIIPAGGLIVFVGQPRSFKTMAALQMMFSVASGHRWLGYEPTQTGSCLYVSEEGAASKVRDRLLSMASVYQADKPIHILHRRGVRLISGDPSWAQVRQTLDEMDDPKVVVLDTLAALMVGDENSVSDIREALRPAQDLITDYGVTVVLVHHVNKGGEGRMGNRMRGSSALWGACDGTLGFVRDEDENGIAVDKGEVRVETKDNEPTRIRFTFSAEHMTLKAEERPHCTPEAIVAEVARRQEESDPVSIGPVRDYFRAGESWFFEQVAKAEPMGLVKVSKGHYRVNPGMF